MKRKNKAFISIVIPAKNEEKSVNLLHGGISKAFKQISNPYEIIFVDDGSADNTIGVIETLARKDKRVKVIKLRGNFGKSIALSSGFEKAKGEIIFTMDADLQDDPMDIPKFLKKLDEGYDLVSGWKKARHDPFSKTFPSKVGNLLTRILTGIKIHDSNCGFKAYRRNVLENINIYGELYKYIPVFADKLNYRVGEVVVTHHKRRFGKSKFGLERNIKGFLDLLTVVFITKYLTRPGHFFGTAGTVLFGIGFIIGLYISYLRLTTGSIQYRQPLLFLGILLMIIGIQLITTGLLAELFTNYNQRRESKNKYIKE